MTGRPAGGAPRAVVIRAFGDPSTFSLEPHDPGLPGAGQVRIAVHASGVSYADVLVAEGKYQLKPQLPFVPGSELSGVATMKLKISMATRNL